MTDQQPISSDDTRQILLQQIAAHAGRAPNATTLLRLAEAWAWLQDPSQPHGGRSDD
ncbi:MAG TPA: hypothetical protein PKE32_06235 [Miltoncostaeaceae bacterium]|nr:hypothetical protein [Miltoncostaeaceae bacterium]